MATTSTSNALPTDVVLSCIDTSIRDLHELRNILLQREETLPQGRPLEEMQQLKLRRIQYSVMDHIKGLEKVFNSVFELDQTMVDADLAASFAQQGRTVVEADPAVNNTPFQVPMLVSNPMEVKGSVEQFKWEYSMNENDEVKEPRYLYVSDGLVICCLELKQSKHLSYSNAADVPLLPKIATIRLLDKDFPISAGLFKLGSDAYMIGGQHLPSYPDAGRMHLRRDYGLELYKYLAEKHLLKGSSCVIYRLSKDDGGILSLKKSDNIRELNEPKIWPVIEKIDGHLHVIDSFPPACPEYSIAEFGTFTHEVLNPDELGQAGWIRIPTMNVLGGNEIVRSHLAVGDCIYSTTSEGFMIFDSTNNKWEAHSISRASHPFCVEHVLHILQFGNGRCVGEFLPSENPLFIVIALVVNNNDWTNFSGQMVAYLVSPTGRVLCFQHLPHIFEGCLSPVIYRDGTVVKVDEQGKMWCAIVNGDSGGRFCGTYLFINMFTVEGLADSASKVAEIWAGASCSGAVELEFVRVVLKERYVFKTRGDKDLSIFPSVQACFL